MVTGIFLPFYTITLNAIPDSFYFNPNTLEKTERFSHHQTNQACLFTSSLTDLSMKWIEL